MVGPDPANIKRVNDIYDKSFEAWLGDLAKSMHAYASQLGECEQLHHGHLESSRGHSCGAWPQDVQR